VRGCLWASEAQSKNPRAKKKKLQACASGVKQQTRHPAGATASAHGGRLPERESPCANKNGSGAREALQAFRNLKSAHARSATGSLFHLGRYGRALKPPAGVLHTPSIAPDPAFAPRAVTPLRANEHLCPTPSRRTGLETVRRSSRRGEGIMRDAVTPRISFLVRGRPARRRRVARAD
jgi:hypothetical protein